ncbi:Tetratricopeptide repeat protein 36 [Papilio machaon]|uniref:Tetratricopeptide repeat protein 36 n=1 Tax=Papilio machaon TaxID=76193 RepID=A0A194RKP1_PAPMA|nr:Tetratricopeptide repeat protein 36 [Papilio machaon]
MSGLENLSEGDLETLKIIFDPTAVIGEVVDREDKFQDDEPEPSTPEYLESKSLRLFGARAAEQGKLEEALEEMNKAVAAAPELPDAYNDRAQVLRLMLKDDDPATTILVGCTNGPCRTVKYLDHTEDRREGKAIPRTV